MTDEWETIKEEIVQGDSGAYFNIIVERHPDYDFRIQRRKKPAPMPKLEPGMGVGIKGLTGIYGVAEAAQGHFYVWNGVNGPTLCRSGYFNTEILKVWSREGELIWERSK